MSYMVVISNGIIKHLHVQIQFELLYDIVL